MTPHRNTIEYEVYGRYALFSEVTTRVGGEKFSYQVPTYAALKGITTEGKGIRPVKMSGGNDLSYYPYLKDVRYQVRAHFEWNTQREDLATDWNEHKHHNIARRAVERGGRRDIFLGTRECQGYVEPREFGSGQGFYDDYGDWDMGYMFHGFTYPDENMNHDFIARFWRPVMHNGIITFERPDSAMLDTRVIRAGQYVTPFVIGENYSIAGEE